MQTDRIPSARAFSLQQDLPAQLLVLQQAGWMEHSAPLRGAQHLGPRESYELDPLEEGACAEEEKGDGKENERMRLLFIDKTLQLSKDAKV